MKITEKLDSYNLKLKSIEEKREILKNERLEYCKENRKEIKKLFPKIRHLYLLLNAEKYIMDVIEIKEGYNFYFRPTSNSFNLMTDFGNSNSDADITVEGILLDNNLKPYYDHYTNKTRRVKIKDLKSIEREKSPNIYKNTVTKVYVMIDKNTGYYKIGRSKKPKIREKTLQSEKPTIEMLFNYDALNKDEKHLHELFKEKRIRGEWFDLNGTDLALIKNHFN